MKIEMRPLAPVERKMKDWRNAENKPLEQKLVMNIFGWVCSAI